MKIFLLKVCLFLIVTFFFDRAIGYGLAYIACHIEIGGQGRDNYICNKAMEDILVFGSSRAVHHYNSQLIEDSTGYTCYNCGEDGEGIILSYGRLLMNMERHNPKIIILDLAPGFDLLMNDNHKYLGWLKAHYDKKGIPDIFDTIDKTEKYKMVSYLYRYNSKFLQNVFVYITSISADTGIKGFRPNHALLNPLKIKKKKIESDIYEFDPVKMTYINKFLDLSGNSDLYVVVSPIWYGMDTEKTRPVKEICDKRGVCFLDFSNNPKYVHEDQYFYNGTHLNSDGAAEFTKDLCKKIKIQSDERSFIRVGY